MEGLMLLISLFGLVGLLIITTYLACQEYKRQKQMSEDLHFIREVIQNVEKENK